MPVDPRAVVGAQNNADLYEAVYRAHGVDFTRLPHAFVAGGDPPPYYSHMTVLSPDHVDETRRTLGAVRERFPDHVGLKDSFAQLDLAEEGFGLLIAAQWTWRAPARAEPNTWTPIRDAAGLAAWEEAWKAAGSPADRRMFPVGLLDDERVSFWGLPGNGGYRAGCLANVSEGCVGLSNCFSLDGRPVVGDAADAIGSAHGSLPIVGYQSGAVLDAAQAAGFAAVGRLQVWLRK